MKQAKLGFLLLLCFSYSIELFADEFQAKSKETVIHKNYPKKYRVEITPSATLFLNQVYLSSFFLGGQISFYASESFGIHLEGAYGFNEDLPSRSCLETFYNDIDKTLGGYKCGYQYLSSEYGVYETSSDAAREKIGDLLIGKTGASLGPSYVPIREISLLAALTFSWNLVYGKQLAFMNFTNYFDLYLKFGGGIAVSNYYPAQIYIKDEDEAKRYRADSVVREGRLEDCPGDYGVCVDGKNANPDWANLIGTAGRPQPIQEISPLATLALGYRFHFLKYMHLVTEVRSYFLIATGKNRNVKFLEESSSKYVQNVEHYLSVSGGLGFRL